MLQTTQGGATTNYLYGLDRLAAVASGTRTWYSTDALGSVRQTLDDAGTPLGVVSYDAWGAVENGAVPTFGFTGELQDAGTGLVNLRARWYSAASGTFTSRDSFVGNPQTPYSQHPYQYGYSNPIVYGDPSGRFCWDLGSTGYDFGDTCDHVSVATQIVNSQAAQTLSECGAGAFKAWALNNTFGVAKDAQPQSGKSTAMTICRHAGNAVSAVQGAGEIIGGGAAFLGGGVACVATIGGACIVTVPIAAAGGTVAMHGAGTLGSAIGNELALCTSTSGRKSGDSVSPIKEPDIEPGESGGFDALDPDTGEILGAAQVAPDGYVNLLVYTDEAKSAIRGGPVFQGLFDKLRASGANIKGILGNWHGGAKPSSNLTELNEAIRNHIPPEQAAENNTFTGIMSGRNGYGKATIDYDHSPRNPDGTFQEAKVYFDP